MPSDKKSFAKAVCDHESHGGSWWEGTLKDSYDAAQKDAEAHNRANSGHRAWAETNLEPDQET